VSSFNGRALGDDALDVMLTLATNTRLSMDLLPTVGAFTRIFHIMERRIQAEEQVGVTPMPRPAKKKLVGSDAGE
jgi:hypothetical protein